MKCYYGNVAIVLINHLKIRKTYLQDRYLHMREPGACIGRDSVSGRAAQDARAKKLFRATLKKNVGIEVGFFSLHSWTRSIYATFCTSIVRLPFSLVDCRQGFRIVIF